VVSPNTSDFCFHDRDVRNRFLNFGSVSEKPRVRLRFGFVGEPQFLFDFITD
jgi:hypothetical protein